MENKLHVQDLRISFRTGNGKVQAVRGIDFDLARGETLAIVGESGSGKSVTSKAILGILAGNSIVESGEIIYDGQDLLKISEEDFHKIRGDRIAMIFQDPMSSLNPIVRIGRQLTEAMLLKGKIRQRESRRAFSTCLKSLRDMMAASAGSDTERTRAAVSCRKFRQFEKKHTQLEAAYNAAHEAATEALDDIGIIAFELEKNTVAKGAADRIRDIARCCRTSLNKYVVDPDRYKAEVAQNASALEGNFQKKDYKAVLENLYRLREIMTEGAARPKPNFFRMGYYLTFSSQPLPDMPLEKLNDFLLDYLLKDFMNDFLSDAQRAVTYSAKQCCSRIRAALQELEAARPVYAAEKLDKKKCTDTWKKLSATVRGTIDPLAVSRDSLVCTFAPSMKKIGRAHV